MRARALLLGVLLVGGFVMGSGCHQRHAANPSVSIANLDSSDPIVRRDAARSIADDPPPQSVGPLVAAANKENNPKALQAMLLALGASGAPEAKAVLDQHADDADNDTRRIDQRALRKWKTKNGQVVRREVAPPPAASAASASTTSSDGCRQFKEVCGTDPFDIDKCQSELSPLRYEQQTAWADCVNDSSANCQKAYSDCILKVKKGP